MAWTRNDERVGSLTAMITELRIRGLGVIDDAVIPFADGLTVVTGETGAGKTMVLTGLDLVSGGRTDATLVRAGSARADADALWRLSPESLARLRDRLEDAGVDVEGEDGSVVEDLDAFATLVLARTIASGGRSRAFAGGRSVPASVLADLSAHLLAVHGQADQITLRDRRQQRRMLDAFGGAEVLCAAFADRFDVWRRLVAQERDLVEHRAERERAAELLRLGIAQIAAVAPAPGEDVELKALATTLSHGADLLAELALVDAALVGTGDAPGVQDLLAQAHRHLEAAARFDADLAGLASEVAGLGSTVADLGRRLAEHAATIDVDPQRLAQVEERRALIGDLKRRFGPELADVLAWLGPAQEQVHEVDTADDLLEAVRGRRLEAAAALESAGCELTAARRAAAERMGAAVTVELRDLAMPDAAFTVVVSSTDDIEQWTSSGADTVEFRLVPHAGAVPSALERGASGGELSRLMLAIEVVLAGSASVPTFVFDEVDAGIGGKVAVEVGRRLARLARSAQVVVVTHLPQVAAFADRHVVVTKDTDGQVTAASVEVVDGPDRVRELVRMLSGLEDSQSGAEHATELLALAAADRADRPAPRGRGRSRR